MKKLFFLCAIASLGLACSGPSVKINGCISGAPNAKITLTRIGAFDQRMLDTLRANEKGCFTYKVKQKGKTFEPFFLSVTVDSLQAATLLVEQPGTIGFESNKNSGKTMVEGSEGSLLLQEMNDLMIVSSHRFDSLLAVLKAHEGLADYQEIYKKINYELGNVYVKHKRASLKFIMSHTKSLATIPALYQKFPNGLSVYADKNDFVYFKAIYDSLQTVYPHSEYVLALKEEYDRRRNMVELETKMQNAAALNFPEIELPDVNAHPVKLSSLEGKVLLLHFWLSSDPQQRIANKDMEEVYNKYHAKGFEIYQIAGDIDKPAWARTVATQAIPWISVCDGLGTASPAVRTYNVTAVPASFLINQKGDIVAKNPTLKELDAQLAKLCK